MLAVDALMDDGRHLDGDAFMEALDPLLTDANRLAYVMHGPRINSVPRSMTKPRPSHSKWRSD